MWKVQGCNWFCISRYFKIKKDMVSNNLAISFLNGCLEKQSFGKSSVGLSVHLPLRHPLPAFESTGDDRRCAEGAEVSKTTRAQKVSGKFGIGWQMEILRALPSPQKGWHNSEVPAAPWTPLLTATALVGINYCPDENLVVANGGRMQRRELGLLI